jgi:hypothetical protein
VPVLSSKLREEETKGEMSSLHSEKKEPVLESVKMCRLLKLFLTTFAIFIDDLRQLLMTALALLNDDLR